MNTRKVVLLSLLLLTVHIFIGHVHLVQAEESPSFSTDEACFTTKRCDVAGGICSTYNTEPLSLVHRASLVLGQNMRTSRAYVLDCIVFDVGGVSRQACLPLPIRNVGATKKLKNYIDEGISASWSTNTVAFFDAMKDFCKASLNPNHPDYLSNVTSLCDNQVDSYLTTAEGQALNTYLTTNLYQFHGLYAAGSLASGKPVPVVDYPVALGSSSSFEIGVSTTGEVTHNYRVVAFYNPGSVPTADGTSNKLSTLTFFNTSPICSSETHDPYGQVFNNTTFEPVAGKKVALYKNVGVSPAIRYVLVNKTDIQFGVQNDPAFLNPQMTGRMGGYTFRVPNGDYKLLVIDASGTPPSVLPSPMNASNPPAGFIMDTNSASLRSPIKVKKGSEDMSLYSSVYKVSTSGMPPEINIDTIEERGVPQRRDISITAPAGIAEVTAYVQNNAARDSIFIGETNKPFGVISLYNVTTGNTLVGSATADIHGKFTIVVPRKDFGAGDEYDLRVLRGFTPPTSPYSMFRRMLRNLAHELFPFVYAQEESLAVRKVIRPNYIEGYAFDTAGVVLPKAKILVFDKVLGISGYATEADENGKFTVPSDKIPYGDYSLMYTPVGSKKLIRVDTQTFITQNKSYLDTTKVDLSQPQYSETVQAYITNHPEALTGVPLINQATGYQQQVVPSGGVAVSPGVLPDSKSPTTQPNPVSSALLMYVAILLLLIVGAGLLIVYYIKRRKDPHLYE